MRAEPTLYVSTNTSPNTYAWPPADITRRKSRSTLVCHSDDGDSFKYAKAAHVGARGGCVHGNLQLRRQHSFSVCP